MGRKKKQKQRKRHNHNHHHNVLLDALMAEESESDEALSAEDQDIIDNYEVAIALVEEEAAAAEAEAASAASQADEASFVEALEGEPGEDEAFLAAMAALDTLSPEVLQAAKGERREGEPTRRGGKKQKAQRSPKVRKPGKTEVLGPLGQMNFVRASLPRKVVRQLRRGGISWVDDLDLHGLTWKEAKSEVAKFLRSREKESDAGYTCYLIIHGKGHGAVLGTATIKSRLYTYLQQQPHVVAAISALPKDGGLGAAYVLID